MEPVAYGFKTEQEVIDNYWIREDAAKALGERLGVNAWVSVCQFVPMPWSEWLSLSALQQRAISQAVEVLAQEREKVHSNQQQKLDAMLAQANSSVKFSSNPSNLLASLK